MNKQNKLGERIRLRREFLHLSLARLAENSGVSKGFIGDLESGKAKNPTLEKLIMLADALHVPVGYLLGEHQSEEFNNKANLKMEENELFRNFIESEYKFSNGMTFEEMQEQLELIKSLKDAGIELKKEDK